MKRTLYVSDLDGTLLNSGQAVSAFTAQTVNDLVGAGMLFSYATARSFWTASVITEAITANIPVIVYNGAFIINNLTGERLYADYFTRKEAEEILELLQQNGIDPIVYAVIDGTEKFSYLPARINAQTKAFLDTRRGDRRDRPVEQMENLLDGAQFYFTCIGAHTPLKAVYAALRTQFSCVYQKEIYSGLPWLEIMPSGVSKANAVLRLKELLDAERVVSFGDGKNDIPLFEVSDECYAVENADIQLKEIATGIIESNECDGVAKWLLKNYQ